MQPLKMRLIFQTLRYHKFTRTKESDMNSIIRTAYEAVLNLAILIVRQTNSGWTTRVTEWT